MGSQEFVDYVRAIGIAAFDLVVGFTAGQIIDAPFDKPSLLPIGEMGGFWKVFGLVLLEAAVTATVMIGARRLMYPPGMDDDTGGMFFMMSVMHQQAFWNNLEALWSYGYGKIRRQPAGAADQGDDGSAAVVSQNH